MLRIVRKSQTERIADYINKFGSISNLEAVNDLGVMRLASRISEMKKADFKIDSETVTTKNRYGEDIHFKRYFWGR